MGGPSLIQPRVHSECSVQLTCLINVMACLLVLHEASLCKICMCDKSTIILNSSSLYLLYSLCSTSNNSYKIVQSLVYAVEQGAALYYGLIYPFHLLF
jgi:hypothetical protein